MRSIHRFIAVLAAAILTMFVMASDSIAGTQSMVDGSECSTVREHNQKAKKVFAVRVGGQGGDFHGHIPKEQQLKDLASMRVCVKRTDRAKYRLMRGAYEKRSKKNRFYRYIDSITPYGEWAIPFYIVHCESSSEGYWPAHNPSGAVGPYQLLGKGAPYPAYTLQQKAEHHIIAYNLYDGGNGASHWVCA